MMLTSFTAVGGKDEDLPLLMKEIKEYHNGKPFEIHGILMTAGKGC